MPEVGLRQQVCRCVLRLAYVQKQVGLRLESTKGPVEVILIDSAGKPTEN